METQQKFLPGDKAIVTGDGGDKYIHFFEIGSTVTVMYLNSEHFYKCIDKHSIIQSVKESDLSPLTTTP